jgi:hypothetical protein
MRLESILKSSTRRVSGMETIEYPNFDCLVSRISSGISYLLDMNNNSENMQTTQYLFVSGCLFLTLPR